VLFALAQDVKIVIARAAELDTKEPFFQLFGNCIDRRCAWKLWINGYPESVIVGRLKTSFQNGRFVKNTQSRSQGHFQIRIPIARNLKPMPECSRHASQTMTFFAPII
jgi:hypothetical protein